MWLVNILNKIFKINSNTDNEYEPIVREMTLIGEINKVNSVYAVQQSTREGVKNYCISATKEDYRKILYELKHLKSIDVYLYLKSRLLIEPFIENDLEKVLEICKIKLPETIIREYSIFML